MIDKLAVILAGEYRTWPKVCKYIFKFFNGQAQQIDYFFVTWKKTGKAEVSEQELIQSFHNETLVSYKIIDDIDNKHSYYRQSYLAKIGNILKKEYEFQNDFVYDQVVVTRPDFYFRKSNLEWAICPRLYYQIGLMHRQTENQPSAPENYYIWIQDIYLRSDSATDDIISQKYFVNYQDFCKNNKKFTTMNIQVGNHFLLAKFLLHRNLLPLSNILLYENFPSPDRKDYDLELAVRDYHNLTDVDLDSLSVHEITTLLYRR